MLEASNDLHPAERLGLFEDPGRDFPFYRGSPVALSAGQWAWLMAVTAAAFLILALPIRWPGGSWGGWLPALLFALLPVLALAQVAPRHWRAIFGRVGGRELRLMLGFALLNIVVSMGVGVLVHAWFEVAPNAAAAQLAAMSAPERIAFFAKMVPQLFGEELVTLLPFLALMHLFASRLGTGRRSAVVAAWLLSSLMFGALHLPTYDGNLVQCLVIIGSARLVLTLPWILTKNIWVPTGAHVINDWLLLSLSLLGAGLVKGA